MRWARGAMLGVTALIVVGALVLTIVAIAVDNANTRAAITLGIAGLSLAATVAKVVFDMFVAPRDQMLLRRSERQESRREDAASEIRALLGLGGTLMLGEIEKAWTSRDADRVQQHAQLMGDAAFHAYQLAERASDKLEVLVGVLWVEASELAAATPDLRALTEWDEHPAAQHMRNVQTYTERVQDRLHEILAGE